MLSSENNYLVFLKAEYVRDAQGFLEANIESVDIDYNNDAWRDVSGPVLLMDITAGSIEEVTDRIKSVYPDADMRVFEIMQVNARRLPDEFEANASAEALNDETHMTIFDGGHTYTVVDSFPLGYVPWNIGKYAPEGYLPLCTMKPNSFEVNTETLKAIRCEGAQEILACSVATGMWHPSELKRYLECHENDPRKAYEVARVKAALPYAEKLKF